jgi:hypothetical protein
LHRGWSFELIGEEASSNFSCFEFLLANRRVYAIERRLSSIFPINGNPFCSVTRFVLRIGRRRTKLPAPLLMNYLSGIISTNRILLSCWLLTVTLIGCSKARTPVEARQPKATPGSPTQPGKANIDPCSLLTAEEIESVQGEPVIDTYSSSQTGRGFVVSQCYFQLHTSANSISLNVTQKSDGPDARDPKEYWRHSFHREDESGQADRKDKRQEEERKSPPERVPDLGDEAFWTGSHVGSALYVLKGDVFIRDKRRWFGRLGEQAREI